jgi:hypothetical protein
LPVHAAQVEGDAFDLGLRFEEPVELALEGLQVVVGLLTRQSAHGDRQFLTHLHFGRGRGRAGAQPEQGHRQAGHRQPRGAVPGIQQHQKPPMAR